MSKNTLILLAAVGVVAFVVLRKKKAEKRQALVSYMQRGAPQITQVYEGTTDAQVANANAALRSITGFARAGQIWG